VPTERDRLGGGVPPENRGVPPRDDRGNSAMALIVGALAVALIIGAFFWFAGDTQDTANLDDPAAVEETVTDEPVTDDDDAALTTDDEDVTITNEETNTTTTMTEEPADDAGAAVDTEADATTAEPGATEEPESGEVIDETQQN
jgi:cytoskeletal protein RodZ